MVTVVAIRCSVVAEAEAGSSRIAAATSSPAPATASNARPSRDPGSKATASASNATPTTEIASSTANAAGRPGSASRLTVRAKGSYPGVIHPAASTSAAATGGAVTPSAPPIRTVGMALSLRVADLPGSLRPETVKCPLDGSDSAR
jgi:hypothetical protein